MQYDHIFDSAAADEQKFPLACGFISTTVIFFEKEAVAARIEASGSVEFLDPEGKCLHTTRVPPQTGGAEHYEEVLCSVKAGQVRLGFPIYEWVDHYPNCDGEHDRWSTRTVGYEKLTYPL